MVLKWVKDIFSSKDEAKQLYKDTRIQRIAFQQFICKYNDDTYVPSSDSTFTESEEVSHIGHD